MNGDVPLGELLEVAIQAGRTAGELLLRRFREGVREGVHSKSTPTDLVSEADIDAQQAIRGVLANLRPDDGFLGEEGGSDRSPAAREEFGRSGLRWVVDPLDGTVNYLFGIPHWSVSVAVQARGGRLLAGVILDPERDELFSAVAGGPPMLSRGAAARPGVGTVLSASGRSELATAMVATGLSYDADVRAAQARVLERLLPRARDIRRFGSAALDMAWTAAGRYDAYFERAVKPWDVAAGTLICQQAGLRVVELEAKDVLPSGVLVAPEALRGPLIDLVG